MLSGSNRRQTLKMLNQIQPVASTIHIQKHNPRQTAIPARESNVEVPIYFIYTLLNVE